MITETLILLLSGKQGSGKTTLAKEISKRVLGHATPINFQYMKFADPIYAIQNAIKTTLLEEFHTEIQTPDGPLMQVIGTEWGRKKDPEFWVKIMQNRVAAEMRRGAHFAAKGFPTLFLIDDARFPNELTALEPPKGELGTQLMKIRLEAPEHVRQVRAEKWRPDTAHPSETALDGRGDWDKIIYSDTTNAQDAAELVWRMVLDAFTTPRI